jgi:hypothetical protein
MFTCGMMILRGVFASDTSMNSLAPSSASVMSPE